MNKLSNIALFALFLATVIIVNGEMIKRTMISPNMTITVYTDESRNYTKRVIQEGQAAPTIYTTQVVLLPSIGAFTGSTYVYASRVDNQVTITFLAYTGTVNSPDTLILLANGTLNEEFYPKNLGLPEYNAGWPVYVTDGGDAVGQMFWYGSRVFPSGGGHIDYAFFRVFGVNSGNFGVGSGRGYNRDISISYFRY